MFEQNKVSDDDFDKVMVIGIKIAKLNKRKRFHLLEILAVFLKIKRKSVNR